MLRIVVADLHALPGRRLHPDRRLPITAHSNPLVSRDDRALAANTSAQ